MPRPNKARHIGDEANLARRIAAERQSRGLSYEGLAKLVTDAGCAIQGSAIYKIEKADPPRRITVDELVAFARVFDQSVDNLLTPMEVIDLERARALLKEMDDADNEWLAAISRSLNLYTDFFVLAAFHPELTDYIKGHRFHHFVDDDELERAEPLFDLRGEAGGDPTALMDAITGVWSQLRTEAMAVADARIRRADPTLPEAPDQPPWDVDPARPLTTPFVVPPWDSDDTDPTTKDA